MAYPSNTPLGRFGIETLEQGPERCVATVPATPLVNPLSHAPTIATLALLVDHLGGLINHCRRGPGQWTVSSELSLEVVPDAVDVLAAAPGAPVLGISRPLGRRADDALGLCELSSGGQPLATATVRSFYIAAPDTVAQDWPADAEGVAPGPTLRELMTLEVGETGGAATVLLQGEDAALNNLVGVVHGGISSMGLELAASAEVNRGPRGSRTAPRRCGSTSCARSTVARRRAMWPTACIVGAAPGWPRPGRWAATVGWRCSAG